VNERVPEDGSRREPESLSPVPADEPATAADRLLALQRSAGNQAVARLLERERRSVLARFSMPLQSGVPAGAHATDFSVFLQIIRAEEAKLPAAEQTNTKLMITRLRKLFYGTPGWDKYLIPGAAGTAPLYGVREVETSRTTMPGASLVDYVEKRTELVGAPTALTDPSSIQEVRMPNGDFVDVGHVLAGLDALNFPDVVDGPGPYNISTNVGAVTGIGDLGSILAEIIMKTLNRGRSTFTDAELQTEVDRMAPAQDMLGNVDAYVIGDTFTINTAAGLKVSDILEQYYGGAGVASAAGTRARNQRFTIFATKVGLGRLSGSTFAHERTWIDRFVPDVQNAAALYTGTVTDHNAINPFGLAQRAGLISGISNNPFARPLLEKFVAELKVKVAAEAAAGASTPVPAGTP
jgi:hypothetical protein